MVLAGTVDGVVREIDWSEVIEKPHSRQVLHVPRMLRSAKRCAAKPGP
jgi:hypothetical protein